MSEQLKGVFATAEEACQAAEVAQKVLMKDFSIEDRQRMIENIKAKAQERVEELAHQEWEETGYGRSEHKYMQLMANFSNLPDTKAVTTTVMAGSKGVTLEVYAPFGVVGAVTPVTNVASTLMGNSVCNLAVGNSVVFNVHPAGLQTAKCVLDLINNAIVEAGGPDNLYTMPDAPNMETLKTIVQYPSVKLISGTGGPAMVNTLMSSGKRVIAAGPGNPPTIIDSTANLAKAAEGITGCASFNNNIFCIAEKEMFVLADVFEEMFAEMQKLGHVTLTKEEADKLVEVCLVKNPEGAHEAYSPNKKFVGKNCSVLLDAIGVAYEGDPALAIFEADKDHPFVQTEQMMPVMPLVKCSSFEQACEYAVEAEHGYCHSASIWTKDLYKATEFGKMINTTVFVMNASTMAAYGNNGEGTDTPTTATPTGEGVTGPTSFARRRRFAMADGQGFPV